MFPGAQHVASCLNDGASTPCLFTWQTGGFSTVTNVTAGVFIYTLVAAYAVDSAEHMPLVQVNSAVAASGLFSVGFTNTSDTVKNLQIGKEAALGATSVLTDVSHYFHLWKRPVR